MQAGAIASGTSECSIVMHHLLHVSCAAFCVHGSHKLCQLAAGLGELRSCSIHCGQPSVRGRGLHCNASGQPYRVHPGVCVFKCECITACSASAGRPCSELGLAAAPGCSCGCQLGAALDTPTSGCLLTCELCLLIPTSVAPMQAFAEALASAGCSAAATGAATQAIQARPCKGSAPWGNSQGPHPQELAGC